MRMKSKKQLTMALALTLALGGGKVRRHMRSLSRIRN